MADDSEMMPGVPSRRVILPCPITTDHNDGYRRVSPLYLQLKHNRREELIIWSWTSGCVVHESVLAEFEREGFTGYQVKPSTVRFSDGFISTEYKEFIVTGWAGMVAPESGIQVVKSCPACHWTNYSGITNPDKLLDFSEWTGEDFFIAWPMPLSRFVTDRVAKWLQFNKTKSLLLMGLKDRGKWFGNGGFTPGRLSNYLPEDLAIRYGRPLGLE